jgi:hypothetical protein
VVAVSLALRRWEKASRSHASLGHQAQTHLGEDDL